MNGETIKFDKVCKSNKLDELNFAYKQWFISTSILSYFNKFLSKGQFRELKAIIERLFVCLCEVYSEDWQKYHELLFKVMENEIQDCTKLKGKLERGEVTKVIRKHFNTTIPRGDIKTIEINKDSNSHTKFTYGKFSQKVYAHTAKRLEKYEDIEVLGMLLRMSALCPQGQQWSIPMEWFEHIKQTYGNIDLIGFSSPQNLQIETKFCSIHPKDTTFGSIGNIFKVNFEKFLKQYQGKRFIFTMNPPFIVNILNQSVCVANNIFNIGHKLNIKIILFFNGPEWKDTMYYQTLLKHSKLKKHTKLNRTEHTYEDCHENTFVPANFESHLFVLDNYNPITDPVQNYTHFTKGFQHFDLN